MLFCHKLGFSLYAIVTAFRLETTFAKRTFRTAAEKIPSSTPLIFLPLSFL